MDSRTRARLKAQTQVMKALAHPTRLFVVEQLAKHELCVCEITRMVGVDTSTVSKHLSLLKNAGIVDIDKRGTNIYYSLKMPCVVNFFSCMQLVLESRAREYMTLAG